MNTSPKSRNHAQTKAKNVSGPIEPYGGRLVNRVTDDEALTGETEVLPTIHITPRIMADLYMIAVGALSPLEGFMDSATYESVLETMKLTSGLPWSIPVVLPATQQEVAEFHVGDRVALIAPDGTLAAKLDVTDIFEPDFAREALSVYGTEDAAHPGVAALQTFGPKYVAGSIHYVYANDISGFPSDNLTPAETRVRFDEAEWGTVVAFQTRNPIHRAHEYLHKCALEMVDGLLIHPLVGETKPDDLPADIRMESYRTILDLYYPKDRVLLSVLPAAMRYAGPREAIFHAIIRRNYGCTHFIVGRDHAGVGDYYGSYDAQEIFDKIDADLLGIVPLKFEHAFWCTRTGQMASNKTSPSTPEERIFLSGSEVREMLSRGERPPDEFTRPEVADILMKMY